MAVEAILGPVLALLISMKFTKYTTDQMYKRVNREMNTLRTELINREGELAKKTTTLVVPMAKALREVKDVLGV